MLIYIVVFTLVAGFTVFGLLFLVLLPMFIFPIPTQLVQYSIPISLILGFIVVMRISWDRISNSIRTLWMMDSVMWELRWIEHDLRRLYGI
ncbi:hypothetical protein [Vulcanisaeta distributa]|uniref:hypothetical protein n=1 Tax=Vulcanisaeta distributa TaxID=164451 RepID=UPI0006D1660B|nr:hypothetical protein [Vulcanisaeta distributa]